MRMAVFSTKPYDRQFLQWANQAQPHDLVFLEPRLTPLTVPLANGFPAVCCFVNDELSAAVLEALAACGVKLVALRCAGFNQVDLQAAERVGIAITRVPAYSPEAVAEHTLGLILTLSRKYHKAYARVREGNFSLEGLLGFGLHSKTVGVIGTGNIGAVAVRLFRGFGCTVYCLDPHVNPICEQLGAIYATKEELLSRCQIVSLHCPLTPETFHLINAESLAQMRPGALLINTSRGALVDTKAVIQALKSGQLGGLGLDVYEEEAELFFEDRSQWVIQDDVFSRLLTFPNVLITGHQAFFTEEALQQIASTTIENLDAFANGRTLANQVRPRA